MSRLPRKIPAAAFKERPRLERFFNDPPPQDGWERTGLILGNIIGFGVTIMMLWVIVRGFW